ncbi:Pyruvate kinase, cytosolic isozyme [Triticum urartu]|uniref:Pyruvate kinase n=3 Tax=Triticum TaxID=4564 RepID=M8A607_TRIUA|nr:Pyruvate kinase, cytosolic isozyme [Triticum urartu]
MGKDVNGRTFVQSSQTTMLEPTKQLPVNDFLTMSTNGHDRARRLARPHRSKTGLTSQNTPSIQEDTMVPISSTYRYASKVPPSLIANDTKEDVYFHLHLSKQGRMARATSTPHEPAPKGPEIRTGFLKDGKPIKLTKGQEITVSTDYDIKGDTNTISMSYKKLPQDVKPGHVILCADGTISLAVLSCDPAAGTVRCRCENTAMLGERKNCNLPGIVVDLPTLTEKDKEDILEWGVPNDIDMIALSFVRKGSDLVTVRQLLGQHAKRIKLMSKVENQEGIVNFDDILRETDAFMVARGDLGMEIPVEKIFLAQKMMIYKCNLAGKPVVTATQMLESMIKSPRPTRAEATDVANAVLDGTDCVMLSGESAAGAYPEVAVKIMARICVEAESSLDNDAVFKEMIKAAPLPMSPLESLASSAVRTANKARATLIVVLTRGGTTAKLVAKYRPRVPILSVVVPVLTTDSFDWTVSSEGPARHSLIYRGLIPLLAEGSAKATDSESTEEILQAALKSAVKKQLCKAGDAVVVLHRIGMASVIKICTVK